MKKQFDIKKLLLLNMPYILMGLFATNFGEAWRTAVGADASAKMLSFFSTLPVALVSWWPSLHPLDLLVGLCCGAGLRLAVYLKSKNAKKYRHGMEYGSARWGTHEDMEAIEAALCEAVEMHDGLVSEDFIDLFVSQVTPLSDSRFAWCLDFSPQPTVAFLNLAGQRKYTTCSMDSKLHFGPFADEEGHTIPFPGSLRR